MKIFYPLGLFLVLYVPVSSWACSCMGSPEPVPAMEQADVVFTGRVLELEEEKKQEGLFPTHMVEFELQILSRIKGLDAEVKTVRVRTGQGGGDCGFRFVKDREYLVYANEYNGRLSTSICLRTKQLDEQGQAEAALLEEVVAELVDDNKE